MLPSKGFLDFNCVVCVNKTIVCPVCLCGPLQKSHSLTLMWQKTYDFFMWANSVITFTFSILSETHWNVQFLRVFSNISAMPCYGIDSFQCLRSVTSVRDVLKLSKFSFILYINLLIRMNGRADCTRQFSVTLAAAYLLQHLKIPLSSASLCPFPFPTFLSSLTLPHLFIPQTALDPSLLLASHRWSMTPWTWFFH